ncbi:hypothetical protein PCL_11009 [Purpureocillium lilacinum]|nr:hypothetical protein PCL_11009 [Purpureocillium lilacinum]
MLSVDTMASTYSTEVPYYAKRVPSVSELEVLLGIHHRTTELGKAFTTRLDQFREDFVSEAGISGCHLRRWRSEVHQRGLAEAAEKFLEQHGRKLWPDNPAARYYNDKLRYTRDHDLIRCRLHQIIIKKNIFKWQNGKHRRKTNLGASVKTATGRPDRPNAAPSDSHTNFARPRSQGASSRSSKSHHSHQNVYDSRTLLEGEGNRPRAPEAVMRASSVMTENGLRGVVVDRTRAAEPSRRSARERRLVDRSDQADPEVVERFTAPDNPKTPASGSAKRKRDSGGEHHARKAKRPVRIRLNPTRVHASDSVQPDRGAEGIATAHLQESEAVAEPVDINGRAFHEAAQRNEMQQRYPETEETPFSTSVFRPFRTSSTASRQTDPNPAPVQPMQEELDGQLANEATISCAEPTTTRPSSGNDETSGAEGTSRELDPFPEGNFDEFPAPSRTPSLAGDIHVRGAVLQGIEEVQARFATESHQPQMTPADVSAGQSAKAGDPELPDLEHRHTGNRSPTMRREETTDAPQTVTDAEEAASRQARASDTTSMPPPPPPFWSRTCFTRESSHTRGRDFNRALTEPPEQAKLGEGSGHPAPPLPVLATRPTVPQTLSETPETTDTVQTGEGPIIEPTDPSPAQLEALPAQQTFESSEQHSVPSGGGSSVPNEPQIQSPAQPGYRWRYVIKTTNFEYWPWEPGCNFEDLTESRIKEGVRERTGLDLNGDGIKGMMISMRIKPALPKTMHRRSFVMPHGEIDAFNLMKDEILELQILAEHLSRMAGSTEPRQYTLRIEALQAEARAQQY